jgi:RNA polymerase sigma factor (sigma-70 family)
MTSPLHPDHAQVAAYLRGEPAAVTWMADQLLCIPRLVAWLRRRCPSVRTDQLPDIAQEAGLTALTRLPSYHGLAPFEAWLHRICELSLYTFMRRQGRQRQTDLSFEPEAPTTPPLDAMADDEHRARIRAAIESIGGAEADILKQRHLEGRELRDIAASRGIPWNTVRTWYYRGLKKLRSRLDDGPDGEGVPA